MVGFLSILNLPIFILQKIMNKKSCICLLYIALLVLPAPILAKVRAEKDRKKRQALAAPLEGLAGATVGPALFALLVATYGIYKIASLGITSGTSNLILCVVIIIIWVLIKFRFWSSIKYFFLSQNFINGVTFYCTIEKLICCLTSNSWIFS